MSPELQYVSVSNSGIIIKGTLRKAKSWKKRFFVLREGNPPVMEYYENERKWKTNKIKQSILLSKPWNICRKRDAKHNFLIVIFTEDYYLSMAAENAEIQGEWLRALGNILQPEPGTSLFKHVWHVNLDNKDLEWSGGGSGHVSLHGPHRVCLTHDTMVLVRVNALGGRDQGSDPIEFPMASIRLYGFKDGGIFFIEPGRSSGIGQGKLWMELGDDVMSTQMYEVIWNSKCSTPHRNRTGSSGSTGHPRTNQSKRGAVGYSRTSNNNTVTMGSRSRCQSLPANHHPAGYFNDATMRCIRTSSEGEHTMKRPPLHHHFNNCRCYSPNTRINRIKSCLTPRHRHLTIDTSSVTSSLPNSSNSSSASSNEQLYPMPSCGDPHPISVLSQSSVGSIENISDDTVGHSPPTCVNSSQRCFTAPGHQNRLCKDCLFYINMLGNNLNSTEMVPPPPNVQPTTLPLSTASQSDPVTNSNTNSQQQPPKVAGIHTRAASFDGSLPTSPSPAPPCERRRGSAQMSGLFQDSSSGSLRWKKRSGSVERYNVPMSTSPKRGGVEIEAENRSMSFQDSPIYPHQLSRPKANIKHSSSLQERMQRWLSPSSNQSESSKTSNENKNPKEVSHTPGYVPMRPQNGGSNFSYSSPSNTSKTRSSTVTSHFNVKLKSPREGGRDAAEEEETEEYLMMHPLTSGIAQIEAAMSKTTPSRGYIPRLPSSNIRRKSTSVGFGIDATSKKKLPPQYPHQRKQDTLTNYSTNSLDRKSLPGRASGLSSVFKKQHGSGSIRGVPQTSVTNSETHQQEFIINKLIRRSPLAS